ncbi:unnamed protein product [Cyprideis torosa]|uniref:Phosphodiesterase n=1 Tax=Cyprideis torosa TaxID=163714 RepID=A0A7R8WEQ9_9CRUS|nr:unnamed protein product [Cyprideis torosa]CAG0894619.1 unnamed protein product [Cyprideis torosa]
MVGLPEGVEIRICEVYRQFLLDLARSIFQEQTDLLGFVRKILRETGYILRSRKCRMYLLQNAHEVTSRHSFKTPQGTALDLVFEMSFDSEKDPPDLDEIVIPEEGFDDPLTAEATSASDSMETALNFISGSSLESPNSPEKIHVCTVPIRHGIHQAVGILQLIDRVSPMVLEMGMSQRHYQDSDVTLSEAVALFCGLGIHNIKMYEKAIRLTAKQQVALECLSYHASAPVEDSKALAQKTVPSAEHYDLYSFEFSDFGLSDTDTHLAVIRMFIELDFISKFHIPYEVSLVIRMFIELDFISKFHILYEVSLVIRMFIELDFISKFHIPYEVSLVIHMSIELDFVSQFHIPYEVSRVIHMSIELDFISKFHIPYEEVSLVIRMSIELDFVSEFHIPYEVSLVIHMSIELDFVSQFHIPYEVSRVIHMSIELDFISKFHIPYEVLCSWILSLQKNYRNVQYHNWRHALNVAQSMFVVLTKGKLGQFMSDLEMIALIVACLSHDLDHRGTNNAFQLKTDSPLALLYSTSTMEHHHFDQCLMILSSEHNNILQALSPTDYKHVIRLVENAILSTDLALYFSKKDQFLELVEKGEWDWQEPSKKELLCGMLMTACDVSAVSKPWQIQTKTAQMVADEFFDQGDIERHQLHVEPIAMMDREKKDELPKMQVEFIDMICIPLYKALSDTFPWLKIMFDGALKNRNKWKKMQEQVEMGLTWINSDSIHDAIILTDVKVEPERVYLHRGHNAPHQASQDSKSDKISLRRSSPSSGTTGSLEKVSKKSKDKYCHVS